MKTEDLRWLSNILLPSHEDNMRLREIVDRLELVDERACCEHYQAGQRDFLQRAVEACVKAGVYGAEGIMRHLEIVCICPSSGTVEEK